MKHLLDFTNKYKLVKTLRFRLVPTEKTAEFISRNQFVESDERRNLEFKKMKGFMDEYHKKFISEVLSSLQLPQEQIELLFDWYAHHSGAVERDEKIKELQGGLRQTIADAFAADSRYKELFGKEFIKEILPDFLKDESDKNIVSRFKNFTTHFDDFHKNRKNMYVEEEKSTAISYRIVNQNMLKYFDNHNVFVQKVKIILPLDVIHQLEKDFADLLSGLTVEEFFSISHFTDTLCQADIEKYNALIGGRVVEGKKKEIKGLNQYINEHNQVCEKGERIPKLKPLFNQILSDRIGVSFSLDNFSTASETIEAIKEAFNDVIFEKVDVISNVVKSLPEYSLNGVYIRVGEDSSKVSQRHFGAYHVLSDAIAADWELKNPIGGKKPATYLKAKNAYIKSVKSISLGAVNGFGIGAPVESYFMALGEVNTEEHQEISLVDKIKNAYTEFEQAFSDSDKFTAENLRANVEVVKPLLDLVKEFLWYVKPLLGNDDESEKDEAFYGEFLPAFESLEQSINPLYNKVRSFVTQKPYSIEKFKINFENVTLLKGWDENKEENNASIILQKDGLYYLGIFKKESAKILNSLWPNDGECYGKMVYKFFKDVTTMIPKCTTQKNEVKAHFEKSNADYELFDSKTFISPVIITKEIFDLNNTTYDGGKKFQKGYLEKTGDTKGFNHALKIWKHFCFSFLKSYKSTADYDISNVEERVDSFTDLSEFYQEINKKLYKITFVDVSAKFIHQLVDEGKMFLFQIYSKDFSEQSKGRPNLHTIYWKMLFDEENAKDVVYQLNGKAEIFYRPASVKKTVVHTAYKAIENKSEYNKQHKSHSTFNYDIVKNRRFTVPQFEFHVQITMNFKQSKPTKFNDEALEFLKQNGVRHIIGIDRGERNLLYLVMLDMKGKIVKQISLNEIVSNPNAPDFYQNYHSILDGREGDRQKARRNWNTIQNIKELKEGYMSQVVHVIVKLMLENDAIVVLENLNRSFMQIRGGIEKSVYQKFEKMLIDKLGYIVDKTKAITENGGALHAVQLADTFDNFNKYQNGLVRQCGFIFYVPAWCTSKIDPTTGFVSALKSKYENIAASKAFFGNFESIRYDDTAGYFVFKTDYSKFKTSSNAGKQKWDICTFGDRIYTHRDKKQNGNFVSKLVNLTAEFKQLFESVGIDIKGNIKAQIMQQEDKAFFETLHRLLRLTLQMRNSNSATGDDYIISPVKNKDGKFFDSRNAGAELPQDADANGAFNIARKGLMLLRQLAKAKEGKKFQFEISNEKWLEFAQK